MVEKCQLKITSVTANINSRSKDKLQKVGDGVVCLRCSECNLAETIYTKFRSVKGTSEQIHNFLDDQIDSRDSLFGALKARAIFNMCAKLPSLLKR